MQTEWKRAIVIGASSGIGRSVAEQLLASGISVALVARRVEILEVIAAQHNRAGAKRAFTYQHDVSNVHDVPALFQKITHDLGGLDLIVYASGVLNEGEVNEYVTSRDVETITINFTGAVAWLNEAAMRFMQVKAGTIVGISSVAGDRGRRGNPMYNATKSALTTYLEGIRNRLSQYDVSVTTIKPGYVDTDMVRGKGGLFWVVSSELAAKQILRAAAKGRSTAYVPRRWRYVALILQHIPSIIFKRLPV